MEYTKEELLKIMEAYVSLDKGYINNDLLSKAYDLLKTKSDTSSPQSKIMEINRLVIGNYHEIMDVLSKADEIPITSPIINKAVKIIKKKLKAKKIIRKK
jgi:hypothetical protein